jgi:DNA-binding MarR family transcriptional regulator
MAPPNPLKDSLRQWVEALTHRSMGDLKRFAKTLGLSLPQLSVLMRLNRDHRCGVSDVGTEFGVTNAAASQLIDGLVQKGLVERFEDPDDRRVRHLRLTAKGRAAIHKVRLARERWLSAIVEHLTPEQRAEVLTAVGHLREAARQLDESDQLESHRASLVRRRAS